MKRFAYFNQNGDIYMKKILLTVTVAALATTAHSSTFMNQFDNGLKQSTRTAMNMVGGVSGFTNITQPKKVAVNTNVPSQFLKNDGVAHMAPAAQSIQPTQVHNFMDFVMPGLTQGFRSPVLEATQKLQVQSFKQSNLGFSKLDTVGYKPVIALKPEMKDVNVQDDFVILQKPITHEIAIGDNDFKVIGKPETKDMGTQLQGKGQSKKKQRRGRLDEQDNDATLYNQPQDLKNQDIKRGVHFDDPAPEGAAVFGINYNRPGFQDNFLGQQALRNTGVHLTFNINGGLNPEQNQGSGFFSNFYNNLKATIQTGTSLGTIGAAGYFGVRYLASNPGIIKNGLGHAWNAASFVWKASKWFR